MPAKSFSLATDIYSSRDRIINAKREKERKKEKAASKLWIEGLVLFTLMNYNS